MENGTLTLKTILSAMNVYAVEWGSVQTRRQSCGLLQFFAGCLYADNQGNLLAARFTLSHIVLTRKIGDCREWYNHLLDQLRDERWITYSSIQRPDGFRTIRTDRIGTLSRRVLITLSKFHMTKTEKEQDVTLRERIKNSLTT
jgi:hypothetical protein